MEWNIRLFGIVRDREGKYLHTVHSRESLDVAGLREILEKDLPILKKIDHYLLAVNEEYGDDELILKDGDDIAIIPPVSGG